MTKDDILVIELNERFDKIRAEQLVCPQCGDHYMTHISYVLVPCKKCGITYRTDFKQDIYTKKARDINSALYRKNGIKIIASEAYEQDIIHIREHFIGMNCWDVSELKDDLEEHRRCMKCGMCMNCFTCKGCGKAFEKDHNRKKQICPHCQSSTFVRTYFKEVFSPEENKNIRLCPHCKSDEVVMTRSRYKSKCHICESKQLSEKKSETLYTLIIRRKRAYRKI